MKNRLDISISYSAILCIGAIIISCTDELILPLILAAAIHEAGHIITILCFGGKISTLSFNAGGLTLTYNSAAFTYYQDIVCALSGPLAGIITAFLSSHFGYTVFAGINLCFSLFNLIPVRPLDGGKIFRNIVMLITDGTAELFVNVTEIIILVVLCCLSLYVFVMSKNAGLLIISIVLTFYYCKER